MIARTKESYKHRKAKDVLCQWLRDEYSVHTEVAFEGFRPDIAVYKDNHIQAFYEVEHSNEISGKTISAMQYFCYVNDLQILLHVVDAEYILCQCDKPEKLKKITCNLIT